ncbi:MAG: phosphatidylglycerol lysyltransferase domain-containing protein [Sphingobacterium sp.]|jgi:phosphatidylglycerol lysyltransferase|nr:phosphatidylglycerol lysyltransferase domain-containing protein [Sphingobacterium sp.]
MKNKKIIFKATIGLMLFIGALFFFINQGKDVKSAMLLIESSSLLWVTIGVAVSLAYIVFQGFVYTSSFKVVGARIPLLVAMKLFLKRNFLGVFLPVGGFTSLGFFRNETDKEGISRSTTDFASIIYTLISLFSLLLLSLVVLLIWGIKDTGTQFLLILFGSSILWIGIFSLGFSFYRQGWGYRFIVRFVPAAKAFHQEFSARKIAFGALILSLLWAILVEILGIVHLYIAMLALGLEPSLEASLIVYTVATLFYCFSPFMKGIGIVEMSMTVLLCKFGYSEQQAISISLLYRLFEFWGPLLLGAICFFVHKDNIFVRIFPSLFIFSLGVINTISAFTPAIRYRVRHLDEFFTGNVIIWSNAAILFSGIFLIMCSAFLIRGLRAAWYFSLFLCIFSVFGNLSKGLDYEEATFSFLVVLILIYSYKHYFVPLRNFSTTDKSIFFWIFSVILLYGILGFYFLNKKHFNMDFTFGNALMSTLQSLLVLNGNLAKPQTTFGQSFLYSLNFFGIVSTSLLIYWLSNPQVEQDVVYEKDIQTAKELLRLYGRSPVDYFKTYGDKSFFFNEQRTGFISYRTSHGFAVALEGPVCPDEPDEIKNLILSFDRYCRVLGLKTVYYRVDKVLLGVYRQLGKKHFLIGEEALVDVQAFSLQGKKRKSLRNAVNNIEKRGCHAELYRAPLSDELVNKLRHVSDNWLSDMKRTERIFSQGMFDESKIKESHVITLEDADGKILSFLNIIPDYAPNEATYDLIRKLDEAPGGNMDILLLRFFEFCREEGYPILNMGLAPFSGFDNKKGSIERMINFLYHKDYFKGTKGLREFKEKFEPKWIEKYIVYSHDFDLIAVPLVLEKAMRPSLKKINCISG